MYKRQEQGGGEVTARLSGVAGGDVRQVCEELEVEIQGGELHRQRQPAQQPGELGQVPGWEEEGILLQRPETQGAVSYTHLHGVLSGPAIDRINSSVLDEVIFLDTIPAKPGVKCEKIKYISVAHMFAEAISHIYMETSVSPLFL